MKIIRSILYFLLLISLSCRETEPLSLVFERQLPAEDLEVLNELLFQYDAYVEQHFKGKNKEETNRNYLQGFVDKTPFTFDDSHCDLWQRYDASTLSFQSDWLEYDTVYSAGLEVIKVRQDGQRDTSLEILYPSISGIQGAERTRLWGYYNWVHGSSFQESLEQLNSDNPMITEYLEGCQDVNGINSYILAHAILLVDTLLTEDYFLKRIFVKETFPYLLENYCTPKSTPYDLYQALNSTPTVVNQQDTIFSFVNERAYWKDSICTKIASLEMRKTCAQQRFLNALHRKIELPRSNEHSFPSGVSTTIVQLVIERDGTMSNISIIRSIHPVFDAAILDAFNNLTPSWMPAKVSGRAVASTYLVPVKFHFE